jgi:hypothetical protein
MKKNFTLIKVLTNVLAVCAILLLTSTTINAQVSCNNATVLWSEDFGAGTTITSSPDVLTTGLFYQQSASLASEGSYRVADNTQQKPEWHASADHTGNTNGKMLVVNGQAEKFYQHTITSRGFVAGNYGVSIYVMNIDTSGICAPNPLLPIMTFTVEYLSENNTWVELSGSPFTADPVTQTVTPTWVNLGSTFTLGDLNGFFPTQMRITIGDGTIGGCGNDFAMDDVAFSLCPEGGVAPVTLTSFSAHLKGNGVGIDWTTSQELNNKYFQVERSADGNSNWSVIATVNGSGNSQVAKKYDAFDASPLAGVNYYRLKQVDYDGKSGYSKTVAVKLQLQKPSISVIANPFYNTLSVNFVSSTSQMVTARLIDVTGKQIAVQNWSVNSGTSKKDFNNLGGLHHGLYILSIVNNSGEILFNGKVIKQ